MAKTIEQAALDLRDQVRRYFEVALIVPDDCDPLLPIVHAALKSVAREQRENDEGIAQAVSDKAGLDALRVRSAGMADEFEIYQHHRRSAADEIVEKIRTQETSKVGE